MILQTYLDHCSSPGYNTNRLNHKNHLRNE